MPRVTRRNFQGQAPNSEASLTAGALAICTIAGVTVQDVEHDTGKLEARRSAGIVAREVRRGRRYVQHRHERVRP